ncbi:MAG: thioredoxin family protein [Bacteroidales bacterium]|jgi:peroxiredoxin|nr:thioredoxin family protein [Bacteroidales bacterium]NPV37053.1 thioredoxin family protein [Bacteroidales bacterium]
MKTIRLALLFALTFFYSVASYSQGVKPGDIAPSFALKNIDGKIVSLGDYKNAKGVILIFTCNHCPYSVAYEDRIIALDKKYKPQGWPVVAINPNDPTVQPMDSFEKMQERAAEKGFTFPYLFDEGQKIFPQYGASRTPHVFLLQNTDGKFIVRYIGAIDNNYEDESRADRRYVEEAIAALEAGQIPATSLTKAIGCSIKVKK